MRKFLLRKTLSAGSGVAWGWRCSRCLFSKGVGGGAWGCAWGRGVRVLCRVLCRVLLLVTMMAICSACTGVCTCTCALWGHVWTCVQVRARRTCAEGYPSPE